MHDDPTGADRLDRIAAFLGRGDFAKTLRAEAERRRAAPRRRAKRNEQEAWGELPPPGAFADGPFGLGYTADRYPVRLTSRDLNGPVTLVVGPPGAGKTTLLDRIARSAAPSNLGVVMVDTKSPLGAEAQHGLPVLQPRDAALDLRPPQGVSLEAYMHRTQVLVEQTAYVYSGSRYILEIWHDLLEDGQGATDPCMRLILDRLERKLGSTRPWNKAHQHLDSAYNALSRIVTGSDLFAAVNGMTWEQRFQHSHCLRLNGLSAEAIRFAALLYMEAMQMHAMIRGWSDRKLRTLLILDDARVVARDMHRTGQPAVDVLTNAADLFQAYGIGLVISLQHLGEVSRDLLSSANGVVLVGPITDTDIRALRDRLDIDSHRAHYLKTQAPFRAVIHIRNHVWNRPAPLLLAPPLEGKAAEEAHLASVRARESMLAGQRTTIWTSCETSEPDSNGASEENAENQVPSHETPKMATLDEESHKLLVACVTHPYAYQQELGLLAGYSGRVLSSTRMALEDRGLVRGHKCSSYTIWEPTDLGFRAIGREPRKLPGRGSYSHRVLQERWRVHMVRDAARVSIEHTLPKGIMDGTATLQDGSRVGLEIVLSNDTMTNSIEKLLGFDGDRWLVVLDTKACKLARLCLSDLGTVRLLTVMQFMKLSAGVIRLSPPIGDRSD